MKKKRINANELVKEIAKMMASLMKKTSLVDEGKSIENIKNSINNILNIFDNNLKNNKWIEIPNKNLYFNKEIMTCYPNFKNNFQNIQINSGTSLNEVLNIIKKNEEYSKYGIEWDIQTYNESINSFYDKSHPMDSDSWYRRIQGWNCLTYKNNNTIDGYNNDPNQLGNGYNALLIPIFRLLEKERYEELEKNSGFKFNCNPKEILELFIKNELIPRFINDSELKEEYQELINIYKQYKEYMSNLEFIPEKVLEEIVKGDKENLFEGAKIEIIHENGDKEYVFSDGKAYLYKAKELIKRYIYEDGKKKDITTLYNCLNVDKERVNLDPYDENILFDPNRGHWDLFESEDKNILEEGIERKVYSRDPRLDIKQGGLVGIDFGTKSTVVVFQDDSNRILPMRISGGILNKDIESTDYENPTVIEFKDLNRFMKKYEGKTGRPDTSWQDVTVSHTAFQNLITGTNEEYYSTFSDLKQWAGAKGERVVVRDKKGEETLFEPYLDLKDGSIDPIELYAYYIGSYINTMRNGIYLEYFLSFPVTYEKEIRERILKSFERGIKKSLPTTLVKDEEVMKKFKVRHGANEPAAYSICALQEYGFELEDEDEKVYYGVFDFGGGTLDFDFGIWKLSEDERSFDYELEHFGAGGDKHLGGENLLKELAFEIFKENEKILREQEITFYRPEWCERFMGDEIVTDNSQEAKLNIKVLMEKIRPLWEKTDSLEARERIALYTKKGELKTGIELEIDAEEIERKIYERIEGGIKNFFNSMETAFKNEDVEQVNILLAGNSSKHPYVKEIFEKEIKEREKKAEIFPALATEEAYAKMEERGLEAKREDKTKPTGKTGVAYGILESRAGGRIKVVNRDEEKNENNEINFKYFVGYQGRKRFKPIITPQSEYNSYEFYLSVTADTFDIYYTNLPEAATGKMEIEKAKRKRITLNENYADSKIYIKAIAADTIEYAISSKDISENDILESGEIQL